MIPFLGSRKPDFRAGRHALMQERYTSRRVVVGILEALRQ